MAKRYAQSIVVVHPNKPLSKSWIKRKLSGVATVSVGAALVPIPPITVLGLLFIPWGFWLLFTPGKSDLATKTPA